MRITLNKTSENLYTVNLGTVRITGRVRMFQYVDRSPGLLMSDDEYGGDEVLSINLSQYGLCPPEGYIYVKDWSEHIGLADALETAGVVKKDSRVTVGQFNSPAWLCEIIAE